MVCNRSAHSRGWGVDGSMGQAERDHAASPRLVVTIGKRSATHGLIERWPPREAPVPALTTDLSPDVDGARSTSQIGEKPSPEPLRRRHSGAAMRDPIFAQEPPEGIDGIESAAHHLV